MKRLRSKTQLLKLDLQLIIEESLDENYEKHRMHELQISSFEV